MRKVNGVGGRACLVVHHIYGVAPLTGGNDRIHKVFAPRAKKPCCAHNARPVWQNFHNGLFALKLGAGIDRGWLGSVCFFMRGFARARKNEVCAVLHHKARAQRLEAARNGCGQRPVELAGFVLVVFGIVNGSPGHSVEHHIGLGICNGGL